MQDIFQKLKNYNFSAFKMKHFIEIQEGGDICIPMVIHVGVWQKKPTQYCKAIILQLKIYFFINKPF